MMPIFFLDSNVFIQAKNGPYGFDIVPAFWEWLDKKAKAGVILSSIMVYGEISKGDDDLAEWVKDRKNSDFFKEPSENCQKHFAEIAQHVTANYPRINAEHFLAGADPWVIAQAKSINAIVVTYEVLVSDHSSKVKIPNICKEFDVNYCGPYQMLRELRAKFRL